MPCSCQPYKVNNVGKSYAMPAYFVQGPKDEIDDILKININGTVNITYSILPQMIKQLVTYLFS
jgi:17beta-estradiol 17-dehydrogenase / very-long-chain 3-oxoacyl-CoA reductase